MKQVGGSFAKTEDEKVKESSETETVGLVFAPYFHYAHTNYI